MPKVGVAEVYTESNGYVEIDLYDPADFDFSPIELPTVDGDWGVPYLDNPSEVDTPIEVYTSARGWQGINSTGIRPIDLFENYGFDEYSEAPSTGGAEIIPEAALGENSTLGAHFYGQSDYWSMPMYSTPLPNYPEQGTHFRYLFKLNSLSGESNQRIFFAVQQDKEQSADREHYEIQHYADGAFRIQKDVGRSDYTMATGDAVSYDTSTIYQNDLYWAHDDYTVDFYSRLSDYETGSEIQTISGDDTEGEMYLGRGIGFFTTTDSDWYLDDFKILPD